MSMEKKRELTIKYDKWGHSGMRGVSRMYPANIFDMNNNYVTWALFVSPAEY
jgi:hypothetical protein